MEPYGGMVDVLLGYDTDLHFENGDLMTTTGIDYIEREIYKLLITERGDWGMDPRVGCTPNFFSGSQNTRETGKQLEEYLRQGLSQTVFPAQVVVRCVPTNYDTIMIFIDLIFQNQEIDSIPFEFDFINGIRKFDKIDPKVSKPKSTTTYKVNDIVNKKHPNKYWDQIRKDYLS